ncbi:hypothetical protein SprV_0200783500 [Sparganum proliferum]
MSALAECDFFKPTGSGGASLAMPVVFFRSSAVVRRIISERFFSVLSVKKHTPLIKFRSQRNFEAEKTSPALAETPVEIELNPNFCRKALSDEEIMNFQFGGLPA